MNLPGTGVGSGADDGVAGAARIVARVAHELNGPLQIVLGQAEQALTSGRQLPERLQHRLEEIQASALRMADVVRSIVVYARDRRLRRTRVYPHAIADSVLAARGAELERDGIKVLRAWDGQAAVHADAPLLEEAVTHLVANAHEAMRAQGGTLLVRIDGTDERVVIAIEDSGPGVPLEARPRLFVPLSTANDWGRGLGLAVCHAIVAEHGGSIAVTDAVPRGARFVVDLPAAPPTEPACGAKPHKS